MTGFRGESKFAAELVLNGMVVAYVEIEPHGILLVWTTICEPRLGILIQVKIALGVDGAINRPSSRSLSRYCQPGTPRISGRWWAMPLWQSMQVFSPVNRKRWSATEARGSPQESLRWSKFPVVLGLRYCT